MKIGAMVESFRLGFRGGVEKAASLGIEGIQAYATDGELAPEKMTAEKIRETLDIVKSNGVVFSAICGDFGYGFNDGQTCGFLERQAQSGVGEGFGNACAETGEQLPDIQRGHGLQMKSHL